MPVFFQSFYSVSLTPPLVSFCVMKTSKSWPGIRLSRRFTVNVLSEEQQAISDAFARAQTSANKSTGPHIPTAKQSLPGL